MKSRYWALMALALMLTTGCTEEVADPAAGTETPATETTETEAPVTAAETPSEPISTPTKTPATAAPADTAQAAAQAVIDGLASGKADAVWAALPSGYQDDITELIQGFGNGMDPNVWQQIQGAIEKVHTVLDTKGDFIANVPALQGIPDSDKFTAAIPQVAGLLKTIIGYSKLDGIKTFDGQEFFSGPASTLMSQVDALSELSPEGVSVTSLKGMTVETVSSEGDTTTLKFTNSNDDSEPNEVEFVKVDGHWVPADIANRWDISMAAAREGLKTLPETLQQNGPMIGMFSQMITAGLDPLAAAEDQEQFNQAVEQLQAGLGGIPMLGGLSLGSRDKASIDAAKTQISLFKSTLEIYSLHNSEYPTSEQGLKALVERPSGDSGVGGDDEFGGEDEFGGDEDEMDIDGGSNSNWKGPYLRKGKVPKDPWGTAYRYEFPGQNNKIGEPDIWSLGPDRKDNTEDDIVSWYGKRKEGEGGDSEGFDTTEDNGDSGDIDLGDE